MEVYVKIYNGKLVKIFDTDLDKKKRVNLTTVKDFQKQAEVEFYVEGKKIKSLFFKNLPSVKARIVDIPVIIELANEDLLFIQYQGTDNEIKNYRLNLKQHEKNFNIFKIVIAILLISLIPFCIFLWFNLDLKNKMDFTKFNIERSRVKENKKSDIIDNSDKTLNYNEENKIENIEKYSPKYTIESLNDIVNQNNPLYFVKDKAILQPGEIDKLKFILDYFPFIISNQIYHATG